MLFPSNGRKLCGSVANLLSNCWGARLRLPPLGAAALHFLTFSHIFSTGGSEGGRLSAASAAVQSDIRPPPLLIWAGVFGDGSSHYTRPHLHAHAERGADTAGPEPSERTACEDTEGGCFGHSKSAGTDRAAMYIPSRKKKKEKKNDKWHKVKSVPCAQTAPALAITAADVGESARLDALPHFFFYGLLRRLGEDLITVLCVCSPWGAVGVKTPSADLVTPLCKSVLWACFSATFIGSLKAASLVTAPGMLLELWLFPRTHTVLLAAAGGSLFPAGSFQSESLQGCFWTNVILKHTNKQSVRQTVRTGLFGELMIISFYIWLLCHNEHLDQPIISFFIETNLICFLLHSSSSSKAKQACKPCHCETITLEPTSCNSGTRRRVSILAGNITDPIRG